MERHVALVAVAEIDLRILGPLVRLGEQHLARRVGVHLGADLLEDGMGFGEVLVVGAFPLHQIRHGVEPQPVDPEVKPEAHDAQHFLHHRRVVEVQIGLMRIEAMPVIGARGVIPGPVALLGIDEDDACAGIFRVVLRPDIKIALG
jgi:hypothetical protein